MKKALLVIDLQNDYFPGGSFPLWNAQATLENIVQAIARAQKIGAEVVHIQHVADPQAGIAPFFNAGTAGVEIRPEILSAAPHAPIVVKHYADGFYRTDLEKILAERGITELLVCGMMTQNCVTHTAISPAAAKYKVSVLTDGCTTVSQMIHLIALNALSIRVPLVPWEKALG